MCINVKCSPYSDGEKMKNGSRKCETGLWNSPLNILPIWVWMNIIIIHILKCQFSFNKPEVLYSLALSIERLLKKFYF